MRSSLLSFFVIGLIIAFLLSISFSLYQKNKANLTVYKSSKNLQPLKVRFAFAWLIYCMSFVIIFTPIFWLMNKESLNVIIWTLIFILLFLAPSAYPYYTIAIFDNKVNGPSISSWQWQRTEINLAEIDKDKILKQKLGRKLGITIIHSTNRAKILTLGLDSRQLSEILEFASKNV